MINKARQYKNPPKTQKMKKISLTIIFEKTDIYGHFR